MANADTAADAVAVDAIAIPERHPWGALASLAWYLLIFEGEIRLQDFITTATGLATFVSRHVLFQGVYFIAAWGIRLGLVVLAVRLTRLPLREYLGWTRPRILDVSLGILIITTIFALLGAFVLAAGAGSVWAQSYRAALAAGTSPWWFVLQWWPAIILAPFVEETFFRGFLWRGVQSQLGNWAAFLVSTLLFAAMHYHYWMPDGGVDPGSIIQYLVLSSIFGWLRWHSGGTVSPMVAHALSNSALPILKIVLSGIAP
jgi:membrane protease YdiL (CAAX protease family)